MENADQADERLRNEESPDSMPLQNQGAVPVIVRLVDGELGEHYRPVEARR